MPATGTTLTVGLADPPELPPHPPIVRATATPSSTDFFIMTCSSIFVLDRSLDTEVAGDTSPGLGYLPLVSPDRQHALIAYWLQTEIRTCRETISWGEASRRCPPTSPRSGPATSAGPDQEAMSPPDAPTPEPGHMKARSTS